MPYVVGTKALRGLWNPLISQRALRRSLSTSRPFLNSRINPDKEKIDIETLLSKPTWSISSLLPPKKQTTTQPEITPKQLHHLLRLSALPPPKDSTEEAKMLSTLSSQLHFVKEIQAVDTTGVEPLRSLRDETQEGEKDAELGLEALRDALAKEEVRGKFHKRLRRRREESGESREVEWDPLATAERKVGRFFVVDGGKEG